VLFLSITAVVEPSIRNVAIGLRYLEAGSILSCEGIMLSGGGRLYCHVGVRDFPSDAWKVTLWKLFCLLPAIKMNLLQDAIRLNNDGARLLRAGRHMDAAHMIRQAAAIVQAISIYDADGSSPLRLPYTIGGAGPAEPRHDSHTLRDITEGAIHVYARPMLHPTSVEVTSLKDVASVLHSLNCCMSFNLALACHLHGIETGTSMSLDQAMEMYQLVLTGLCMDPQDTPITDSMSTGLLQCVILNNLSHIHSELCEHDYSIYCMDCMVDLLGKMGCPCETGLLLSDESDAILLNLMARQYFEVAPAA
jgi:hypothetical protein